MDNPLDAVPYVGRYDVERNLKILELSRHLLRQELLGNDSSVELGAQAPGKRDGMKSVRECKASVAVDLATLVWTRGRTFPVADLGSRMKCPRCGSRHVLVAFDPPKHADAATAAVVGPH